MKVSFPIKRPFLDNSQITDKKFEDDFKDVLNHFIEYDAVTQEHSKSKR